MIRVKSLAWAGHIVAAQPGGRQLSPRRTLASVLPSPLAPANLYGTLPTALNW